MALNRAFESLTSTPAYFERYRHAERAFAAGAGCTVSFVVVVDAAASVALLG